MQTLALSKSDEKKLQGHLKTIEKAKLTFNESVVVIGRELAAVREILTGGAFLEWVNEHCGFSKSTAYNYLGAFSMFGDFQRLEKFEPKAMYILAPCEEAATQAKELATGGQWIDEATAREMVAKFRQSPKTDSSTRSGPLANASNEVGEKPDPKTPTVFRPETSAVECSAEQLEYTCRHCGGHEADDDGDCADCHEPAMSAPTEPEPEAGHEPHEATKPLDKLKKALAEAARQCADAQKILPGDTALAQVFAAIDQASKALYRVREAFKRKPK